MHWKHRQPGREEGGCFQKGEIHEGRPGAEGESRCRKSSPSSACHLLLYVFSSSGELIGFLPSLRLWTYCRPDKQTSRKDRAGKSEERRLFYSFLFWKIIREGKTHTNQSLIFFWPELILGLFQRDYSWYTPDSLCIPGPTVTLWDTVTSLLTASAEVLKSGSIRSQCLRWLTTAIIWHAASDTVWFIL